VIVSFAGRAVTSPATVSAAIATKKPGQRIRIVYADQAGTHTTTVTLASGPPQ
jgi:S1-C subfamily serine protease